MVVHSNTYEVNYSSRKRLKEGSGRKKRGKRGEKRWILLVIHEKLFWRIKYILGGGEGHLGIISA